jgi:hypothetical protein
MKEERIMIDDNDAMKSIGLFGHASVAVVPILHDDIVHVDHTDGHIDHIG